MLLPQFVNEDLAGTCSRLQVKHCLSCASMHSAVSIVSCGYTGSDVVIQYVHCCSIAKLPSCMASSELSVCVCVCCQVAEVRERHQLEREAIQRGNALERRQLAEEERLAVAARVCITSLWATGYLHSFAWVNCGDDNSGALL